MKQTYLGQNQDVEMIHPVIRVVSCPEKKQELFLAKK